MNTIPHLDFPSLEEVLVYVEKDKFPCSEQAKQILLEETAGGNVIQHVGDAGCMPDETLVYLDFAQDAKGDYPGSVHETWGKNQGYRFVKFLDRYHGALYLRFFYPLEEKREKE